MAPKFPKTGNQQPRPTPQQPDRRPQNTPMRKDAPPGDVQKVG